MTPAARILDRLSRAKRVKPNQWMAACPCCESRKGRPLAVTEAQDGRVLLHAFCGCETAAVLQRIGLTINDLFDRPEGEGALQASDRRISTQDVFDALCPEITALGLIAADFLAHRDISEQDWDRLATATTRILSARDYVRNR